MRASASAPPRAVCYCASSSVTPGSDGGGGRDRRDDELPRRFLEKRQEKQPLPFLRCVDAYSHFVVRS